MKLVSALLILFLFQEVPYKPVEEFQIGLDYTFKHRVAFDNTTVHLDETRKEFDRRTSTMPLPYLEINVKFLKLGDNEARLRIIDNFGKRIYNNRKIKTNEVINLDMGFTDDAKDRVSAHEYTLYLLSAEKKEVSRIVVFIDKNGDFYVNGERRGRF